MDRSPQSREIERVFGHGDTIVERGRQVSKLGEQMMTAADMLESIADGASGQRGLAVDELQSKVGDCYEELRKAGDRYQPTGPVLITYGKALNHVQPKIADNVATCEELWATYQSKLTAQHEANPGYRLPDLVPPTDEEKDRRDQEDDDYKAAQRAAERAFDDWEREARRFDRNYDDWETAFEDAASGIRDATDGNISDSRWDDLDGFVAGALEVLKWVGLAVAILGIIVGGPFLAALGAILAIATLLLTIYSFARGNSSGWDLAWAIVGVIPFGSMSKLFTGQKLGFLNDMVGGLGTVAGRSKITGELGGISHGIVTGFSRADGFLPGVLRGAKGGWMAWAGPNGAGGMNILSRLLTGKRMSFFEQPGLHLVDVMGGILKHQRSWAFRIAGWAQSLSQQPANA